MNITDYSNRKEGKSLLLPIVKQLVEKWYLSMDDNRVYYDNMTGCRSREYYDTVAIDKYRGLDCNVAFIDVDFLKQINDEYGHCYGTHIIKKIAESLNTLKNDNVNMIYDICRVGGDEFILFANPDFNIKQLDILNNVSYGFVTKKKGESVEDSVDEAEKYMYKHKRRKHKRGFRCVCE